MKLIVLVVATLFVVHFPNSALAVETNVTANAVRFLERFGYLTPPDPRSGRLMSEDAIASSLKQLQRFGNIPETGVMDLKTAELINTPRCGMLDFGPSDNAKRKRRYTHQGTKWNKEDLTWRYDLYNRNNDRLQDKHVLEVLTKSLKKWSDVTNLNFKEIKSGTPDILIKFVRGYHRDSYPFDNKGGTLAHAFYPGDNKGLSGDVHFDDDERYTIGKSDGTNLPWVSVHELGHSIGLEHSRVKGAIMYPWYQSYHKGKDFKLTDDDRIGIQMLYGARKRKTEKHTPPPKVTVKPPPSSGACIDHIQAVFLGKDKKTYVINGNKVFVLGTNLKIEEGPLALHTYFNSNGLKFVDAAFTRHDKNTVFFSGDKFYVFDGRKLVSGPRKINDGFSRVPRGLKDISAAFIWPQNDKLYIFKGTDYYRFSRKRNKDYFMDYNYPRKISKAWIKVPNDVDAVFTWKNQTSYFFKGSKYYPLDNKNIEVHKGYPKSIASEWVKCPDNRLTQKGSDSPMLHVTMVTIFASIAALIKLL